MELELHRTNLGAKATLGTLMVNGKAECITLEDVVRLDDPNTSKDEGAKVYGETAIPAGRYRVIINMSPRLQRMMMRLLGVPGFDGILIHSGNDDVDTKGCILVGLTIDGPDHIHGGSIELPILQAKVQKALDAGEEVWITVSNDFLT